MNIAKVILILYINLSWIHTYSNLYECIYYFNLKQEIISDQNQSKQELN